MMKAYRLYVGMIVVLLCFTSGVAFAQDAPTEPTANRPPLVECVAGESVPCSEVVDEVSDIVGVWRSYTAGGSAMGFTVFSEDGGVGTTLDPQTEPAVTSSISFKDGVASIAANAGATVSAACVTARDYKMRLIRIGDQPIALTYRPVSKDSCVERAADLNEPMLPYSESAEELPALKADVNVLAQPLVPCPEEANDDAPAYPCDVIVTQPKELAGIWVQYVVPPMSGVAYIRYLTDGTFIFAGTPKDTAAVSTSFDNGAVTFDDALATYTEAGGCPPGEYYLRVIQWGYQPVALSYTAIRDDGCAVRWSAWSDPMIWIKGL